MADDRGLTRKKCPQPIIRFPVSLWVSSVLPTANNGDEDWIEDCVEG
jgi:hypothetical protein